MRKLSFEIDNIELKEEIENTQFIRARVKAFSSGNNAHNLPVLESALYKAEKTIHEKPLVWFYSKADDDAMGHESQEVPCGFVPKQGANITYERADDDRLFFCVDVLIWRYYSGKILDIFKRTDNTKSVSVEIAIIETIENDDIECIADYSYLAITVLGEKYTPAIDGANAQIVQFSNDKVEVEEILNKSFSKEEKQEKEDELMTFNKEEFAKTFSMTANEMWEMLQNACNDKKYMDGEYEYSKYWMRDYDATYAYAYDYEANKLVAIPYSVTDGTCSMDFENVKNAKLTYIVSDEDSEDLMEFAEKIMSKKMSEFAKQKEDMEKEMSDMKEKMSTFETEKEDLTKKYSELETEKAELSEKFSALENENTELKTFKSDIEEQERKDSVEFALNAVSEDLTQEQMDEWREKSKEFAKVEDFTNALKAFAYEVTSSKKNPEKKQFSRIAIPKENDTKQTSGSVWDRLNK